MKNGLDKKMDVFISYRCEDGYLLPYHLNNYFRSCNIDSFFDENHMQNNGPLNEVLVEEVDKRDNFILLFTEKSLDNLIVYIDELNINEEQLDYVYLELDTAIKKRKNVIPVCIDNEFDEDALKQKIDCLFSSFCMNDSPSYLRLVDNESQLFIQIKERLSISEKIEHVNLSNIIWVGTRASDMPKLPENSQFKGSICLFGDYSDDDNLVMCNKDVINRVDHNDSSDTEQDDFIINSVKILHEKYPEAKFLFYNPSAVYRLNLIDKIGENSFICLNSLEILDIVNNKHKFREWAKDTVKLHPVIERTSVDCDYEDLIEEFSHGAFNDKNNYDVPVEDIKYDEELQFIIQAPISSGGTGTFLMNRENCGAVLASLDKKSKYIVSVYYSKNISVNMHAIIYENEIIFSPGSIQLMREVLVENKLLYKGADFIAYKTIKHDLRQQFESQVKKITIELQKIGYRGVCGIDAIIHNGRVNILEVNGRFQASTELINRALLQRGLKTIQELNIQAFDRELAIKNGETKLTSTFNVPFSNYTYSYEGLLMHDKHIYNVAIKSAKNVIEVQSDGFLFENNHYRAEAYMYRIVFKSNIASIDENGKVLVNENICTPDKWLVRGIKSKNKIIIKIALLILGIIIEDNIRIKLRDATNNAVDLQIENMVINSPTNIKYVEFSPFKLVESANFSNKYAIYYYNELLVDNVSVFPYDKNQGENLKDGKHRYSEIAYLSTDRLRVHLTNACCFKTFNNGKNGCKFCNIEVNPNKNPITSKDVEEVVEKYIKDAKHNVGKGIRLRHFLIGGQSLDNCDRQLIDTVRVLTKYFTMSKYVMTVPLKKETVIELIKLGVNEFSYNIEIFDENCRKKYMPGKGQISVEKYFFALDETRRLLNRYGKMNSQKVVRSMIIIGLEPDETLLKGIQQLIELRIEPMLSIFRPLPQTPLENLNAPTIKSVYNLFNIVNGMLMASDKINGAYMKLGPECVCCQNNTVSLPWTIQKIEESPNKKWTIINEYEKF